MPSPALSPVEAVRVQLEALQRNDTPWLNHGIQTAYEFAEDTGSMERSRYFGFSKDLYHFDHFLGMFQNAFPDIVGCDNYTLSEARPVDGGRMLVEAKVGKKGVVRELHFILCQRALGRKKDCWMVKQILPADKC